MFIALFSSCLAFIFLIVGLVFTGLSAKKWTLSMILTFSGQCCDLTACILILIPLWKPELTIFDYIASPLVNVGAFLCMCGVSYRFSQFLPDVTFYWKRPALTRTLPLIFVKIIAVLLALNFAIKTYAIIQTPNVPMYSNWLWARTSLLNVAINISCALLDIWYCVIMLKKVIGRIIFHKTGTRPTLHLKLLLSIKITIIFVALMAVFLEYDNKMIANIAVVAGYISTDGLFIFIMRHLMTSNAFRPSNSTFNE
jgi:hypothetical protein